MPSNNIFTNTPFSFRIGTAISAGVITGVAGCLLVGPVEGILASVEVFSSILTYPLTFNHASLVDSVVLLNSEMPSKLLKVTPVFNDNLLLFNATN